MINLKDPNEVKTFREACRIAATVLHRMKEAAEVGMNTLDLDQIGREWMDKLGARSACFNYRGGGNQPFPCHTCISVNEEVVHGIGTLQRQLQPGDLVSLDVVVWYEGFIGDNAATICLGEPDEEAIRLLEVTEKALHQAIEKAWPGNRVGVLSQTVQRFVEKKGFSVVRDFVGHGVGKSMHEEPQIPNFGKKSDGPRIRSGMALAIEPMVNAGTCQVEVLPDNWTVVTRDRKRSAHFEHTVLVTKEGPEILTIPKI
ncbi:MAG: type I methionyl aminopeptidase [Opitutales bacterium]|nr:type I methionyl aminopeptidase [Opitutales bacterium]